MEAKQRQDVAGWVLDTLIYLDCADVLDVLRIEWSTRMRTSAGRASYQRKGRGFLFATLKFNVALWERMTREQRFQTAVHEACHLAANYHAIRQGRGRPQSHGREWQALMRRCGLTPDRCHTVDTSGLSRRKYQVRCSCGTHNVGARVARKVAHGRKYTCRRCKDEVRPVSYPK